ncbi:hypothetical protein [[Actinomadura] parvosata]|uniref:hypothetical protein n=1 Tax=[Actinomadura] parvosata TaxID=1955412 RepID=UPI001FE66C81
MLGEHARTLARELSESHREDDPLDQVVADLAEERGSLVDALDELPDREEWLESFSRWPARGWWRSRTSCATCARTPRSRCPT